mmetsp:Transcript_128340/g.411294  ORF Transcript_128340/g.411294 Transcript_128340/m.411294 type:complete len:776 (-) Transcript_128340:630-2957(-)
MKAYLLLYNGACMLGWLFCVLRAGQMLLGGSTYAQIYGEIGMVLMASQTAMCLEILHSLIGLVPSPVGVVTLQVGSRIFIVWGHLYWVPECQSHWSFMFITFSWGITEVVRYLFYFCSLLGGVPYPIFYLRYSMFMVLYPSGITGEIFQTLVGMGAYWKLSNPLWYRLSLITLLLYVPGSPGMIGNMLGNRKRSFKKRNETKVVLSGVVWPKTKKGDRSSMSTNQKMLAAAAAKGPGGEEAASKILKEKKWRFAYNKHLLEHVSQSLQSEAGCIAMARAGLESAQESFQFIRDGHEEMSMKVAMEKLGTNPFDSAEVCGVKDAPSKRELSLTYGAPMLGAPYYKFKAQRNTKITGMDLRKQLDKWGEYGTVEQDVVDALKTLQGKQDEWLDLSDMYFVLLGAASAMGPLHFLLSLGANVIAIARPKALMGILKQAKNGPGKVIFPVAKGTDWKGLLAKGDYDALAKVSGCDLMTQTPEIAAWVAAVAPGKRLTIGNYTYLDGALHVQVAVACDCIMQRLCKERKDTALAFLGTPTDAHVVTKEAAAAAIEAHKTAPVWMKIWEGVGVLKRNKALTSNGIEFMDAIVPDQGPNYILSKRLQHWRAMVARADGHAASSNVSPSTATSSVTSNASFAAAYGGMHIFKPLEVVYQELSLSMMAALLIHDLRNPASAAQPATKLQHPLCLFQATSFHGGIWRCPYTIATIGIPCALKFYLTTFWMHIFVAFVALASTVQYGMYGTLPKAVGQALSLIPAALVQQVSAPLVSLAAALSVPL